MELQESKIWNKKAMIEDLNMKLSKSPTNYYKKKMIRECCICGKLFSGTGNNPYPLIKSDNERCCKKCFDYYVIVAKFKITNIDQYYKNLEKSDRYEYKEENYEY